MNIFKSNPEREQKKLAEQQAIQNRKTHNMAIFEEICKLPVCTPLSYEEGARGVVNAVNGMILLIQTQGSNEGYIKLRYVAGITRGGDYDTYNAAYLNYEEARKILDIWTMMSRPYYCLDWKNPEPPETFRTSEPSNMAEMSS